MTIYPTLILLIAKSADPSRRFFIIEEIILTPKFS